MSFDVPSLHPSFLLQFYRRQPHRPGSKPYSTSSLAVGSSMCYLINLP